MVIPQDISPQSLNDISKGCMVDYVGIEFIEVGDNYLKATMPVDKRTRQPLGLLHGGASVVLAETLGSIGANLVAAQQNQYAVGLEINMNHVHSVKTGHVVGTASAIHIGRSTHVWGIEIHTPEGKLVATGRITMAIMDKKN